MGRKTPKRFFLFLVIVLVVAFLTPNLYVEAENTTETFKVSIVRTTISNTVASIAYQDSKGKYHIITYNPNNQKIVSWQTERKPITISANANNNVGYTKWKEIDQIGKEYRHIYFFNDKGQIFLKIHNSGYTKEDIRDWGGYVIYADDERKRHLAIFDKDGRILFEKATRYGLKASLTNWGAYIFWSEQTGADHVTIIDKQGKILLSLYGKLPAESSAWGEVTSWGGYGVWKDSNGIKHITFVNKEGHVLLKRDGKEIHVEMSIWGGCVKWQDEIGEEYITVFDNTGRILIEKKKKQYPWGTCF